MTVITNLDTLLHMHSEARNGGLGKAAWIRFADAMMDSYPTLYGTAKAMNGRQDQLQRALSNLIAQIELHTDCMDGTIDSEALVDWVDEAEEVLGYGITPEHAAKAQHFINVWIDAGTELPDAETTVLVCIRGASEPVWIGYYNGDEWKDVEGMVIDVTHWAEIPAPPTA